MLRLIVLIVALGFALSANAQSLDTILKRFAADDFAETDAAIKEIAASGAPQGQAILEALAARRLFTSADGQVVFKDAAGSAFNALNGAPVRPGELTVVRVNNRLRTSVEAALSSLTLLSPEKSKRLQAAETLFKSRDAKTLPALELALAREQDREVKGAFEAAKGAIKLADASTTAEDQLLAIQAVERRGGQDALSQLRSALALDRAPLVKDALEKAIGRVELNLRVVGVAQNVWYGLSLGSVLLLAAIGLAVTFGVMGVINMAHGEMVMLGAYTTFLVQETFRTYAPGSVGLALPLAVPLAFLVTALIGMAIERGVIRYLYGRPLETLLATWGVSLILQQGVRSAFGPTNREVSSPSYMSGAFDFLGLQITYGRLWIVVFTLTVFVVFLAVFKLTRLGLQMRAVTQNRRMASSMGIDTRRVDAMTFGIGSGIAGIAGVALSQIDNVSPNLGQSYIIDSFMVVVFGGVGSLWGTLVSAFALGIANKLLEPMAGAVLAKIGILVLLIIFIQKRPRGLFALKGRAVEA